MDRQYEQEERFTRKKHQLQDEVTKRLSKLSNKEIEKLAIVLAEAQLAGTLFANEFWESLCLTEANSFAVLDEDENLDLYLAKDEKESQYHDHI